MRLERLKLSYDVLAAKAEAEPQAFPIDGPVAPSDTGVLDTGLTTKFQASYAAHAACNLFVEKICADVTQASAIKEIDDYNAKWQALVTA